MVFQRMTVRFATGQEEQTERSAGPRGPDTTPRLPRRSDRRRKWPAIFKDACESDLVYATTFRAPDGRDEPLTVTCRLSKPFHQCAWDRPVEISQMVSRRLRRFALLFRPDQCDRLNYYGFRVSARPHWWYRRFSSGARERRRHPGRCSTYDCAIPQGRLFGVTPEWLSAWLIPHIHL
jgi:hypothetical protein